LSFYINDEILEDVRDRSDILDTVSQYVSLKKAGRNFKGLCPFHTEKTPSFIVSPEKQIFHCFGCGKGGNVFQFLMLYEDYSFPEAVKFLASKLGITIPEKKASREALSQSKDREKLFTINRDASRYFHELLIGSDVGEKTRVYLNKRGINESSLKEFELGYSYPSWEHLLGHFKGMGTSEALLEKAGLIIKSDKKEGYYDRFRGRVMFPIYNVKGDIIGFGGRTLDSEDSAKYINSSESLIFQKGKNLFGLNLAKESIRKEDAVLITEGYFDVITAHQNGIKNVVATLGTALTKDHAHLLKRYTKNIYLVFDADKAGESAVKRVEELFSQEMFRIYVVSLPAGSDLDSYLRKEKKDSFDARVKKALPLVEYIIDITLKGRDLKNIGEKLTCVEILRPAILRLKSSIERNHYISLLADKMRVPIKELINEFQKEDTINRRMDVYSAGLKQEKKLSGPESEIVKLFLADPAFLMKRYDKIREVIIPSKMEDSRLAEIISEIYKAFNKNKKVTINNIIGNLPAELSDLARKLTLEGEMLYGDNDETRWSQAMDDCIKKFADQRRKVLRQSFEIEMREAERKGDVSRRDELLKKIHDVTQEAV
jgi:DNA primase